MVKDNRPVRRIKELSDESGPGVDLVRVIRGALVTDAARSAQRGVVTDSVADFAAERDVVLVSVSKRHLPAGGAQAAALARMLHRWLLDNPNPYLGAHWPRCD